MVKANGRCLTCGGKVPEKNLNQFYCSEPCRQEGWKKHHPIKADEKRLEQDELWGEAIGLIPAEFLGE